MEHVTVPNDWRWSTTSFEPSICQICQMLGMVGCLLPLSRHSRRPSRKPPMPLWMSWSFPCHPLLGSESFEKRLTRASGLWWTWGYQPLVKMMTNPWRCWFNSSISHWLLMRKTLVVDLFIVFPWDKDPPGNPMNLMILSGWNSSNPRSDLNGSAVDFSKFLVKHGCTAAHACQVPQNLSLQLKEIQASCPEGQTWNDADCAWPPAPPAKAGCFYEGWEISIGVSVLMCVLQILRFWMPSLSVDPYFIQNGSEFDSQMGMVKFYWPFWTICDYMWLLLNSSNPSQDLQLAAPKSFRLVDFPCGWWHWSWWWFSSSPRPWRGAAPANLGAPTELGCLVLDRDGPSNGGNLSIFEWLVVFWRAKLSGCVWK